MASTVRDIITAAALEVGAVQLGEPLTNAEAMHMLGTWQRLIDSMGLERANIHTIRQDTYPLTSSVPTYTLGLDPNSLFLSVSSATQATTVQLTLSTPHGIAVGDTNAVCIQGAAGLWQPINGNWVATAVSATVVSVPVSTVGFGALTGTITLQVAGKWNAVRPSRISTMNLIFSSGVQTPIFGIDWDGYSALALTVPPQPASGAVITPNTVSGPPLKFYCDDNAPLAKVYLYPEPDQAYYVVVYSEQALTQVASLDQIVSFAQGYERYHVMNLAIEAADGLGVAPTPSVMAKLQRAEAAVKSKNRRSPNAHTDPALSPKSNNLYNYRLGV